MKASLSLNGYMLIDDKKATVEQINDIILERDRALSQNAELVAQNKELGRLLKSAEKQTEQLTLIALGEINLRDRYAEVGRAGFVAGLGYPDKVHFENATRNPVFAADEYAEKVRSGEV